MFLARSSSNRKRHVFAALICRTSTGGTNGRSRKGTRCTKLFLPGNGDRFASQKAWKVHYSSQRGEWHDKPFARLNKLQRKLGCREGYDEWLYRPKGMWHRTFAKHFAKFERINAQCDNIWEGMAMRLGAIRARP